MARKEKQDPSEQGQNPLWPGEGLRKAGEEIRDAKRDETTKIPEIRPDAKRYRGDAQT